MSQFPHRREVGIVHSLKGTTHFSSLKWVAGNGSCSHTISEKCRFGNSPVVALGAGMIARMVASGLCPVCWTIQNGRFQKGCRKSGQSIDLPAVPALQRSQLKPALSKPETRWTLS